jgi:hypothetical protein
VSNLTCPSICLALIIKDAIVSPGGPRVNTALYDCPLCDFIQETEQQG